MAETVDAYNSLLGKYWTQIRVGPYVRPTPLSRGDFVTDRFIVLPLPTELRDDTAVGYTNVDLTSTGDIINGPIGGGLAAYALRKSGDVISGGAAALGGATAGAIGSLFGDAAGDAAQSAVSGGIAEAFPPDQVASAIQQSLGAAPNPNPSVMFTGPSLREFNFSWTFYPRNKTESKKIKDIVEYLKRSALPSNKLSGSASVLSYPMMTQFNFFPWDSKGKLPHGWSDNSIIKMKRTMMTAVNVNYAPSNVPSFFGGDSHPVAIGLSISLREIEYMLSDDWGGSGEGLSADEYKNTIEAEGKRVASQATNVVTAIKNSDNTQDSTT